MNIKWEIVWGDNFLIGQPQRSPLQVGGSQFIISCGRGRLVTRAYFLYLLP